MGLTDLLRSKSKVKKGGEASHSAGRSGDDSSPETRSKDRGSEGSWRARLSVFRRFHRSLSVNGARRFRRSMNGESSTISSPQAEGQAEDTISAQRGAMTDGDMPVEGASPAAAPAPPARLDPPAASSPGPSSSRAGSPAIPASSGPAVTPIHAEPSTGRSGEDASGDAVVIHFAHGPEETQARLELPVAGGGAFAASRRNDRGCLLDINAQDEGGRTPLALALGMKDLVLTDMLLACKDVNVNLEDSLGGFSPLLRASWQGDDETVDRLLNHNPLHAGSLELDAGDAAGRTSLHWAVIRGNVRMVDLLLAAGADVNAGDTVRGMTPLALHMTLSIKGSLAGIFRSRADMEGQLGILRALCRHRGIDVNRADRGGYRAIDRLLIGYTPHLPGSVQAVMREAIRMMLDASLDVNAQTLNGISPLGLAACYNYADAVEILLSSPGLDPNQLNFNGMTALHCAVRYGRQAGEPNLAATEALLKHDGARRSLRIPCYSAQTPLQLAIHLQEYKLVELLLVAEGIPEERVALEMRKPDAFLHLEAASADHAAVLRIYGLEVQHSPPVSAASKMYDAVMEVCSAALAVADKPGDGEARQKLESLDINIADYTGFCALHHAARARGIDQGMNREQATWVARVLLTIDGINVNHRDNVEHSTPLYYAARFGNMEIVQMLLSRGDVDLDSSKERSRPALRDAIDFEQTQIAQALMNDTRVELNLHLSNGETMLGLTAGKADTSYLQSMLSSWRVDVNMRNLSSGQTPIYAAINAGTVQAVQMLIKHPGFEINCRDINWDTPLSFAVQKGNEEIVRALLAKNPDITLKNFKGLDAFEIAYEEGRAGILDLLNHHAV
ncbi:ankyrin repeat-containing domain protein [Peziza echinospora]|nr:ankyrin repeat-containing domain protein [Peziza echinospora]